MSKRIRSLERGLAVIEQLSNRGVSTLADLRRGTGLTNATLLRILETLQERGWVRRNIAEGQYELAHSLGVRLGASAKAHPLAEAAAPILLGMKSRQTGLPSDLCTITGPGSLEVVESTRLRGPMAPVRTSLGIRPSMVLSAHGRAVLAFSPEDQSRLHLEAVAKSAKKAERPWLEAARLEAELQRTRARGYGLKEEDYFVENTLDPGPDLGAIAVPIVSASGIHGTVSLLWLRDDTTLEEVLALGSLEDMQIAAKRIAAKLERAGVRAPRFDGTPASQVSKGRPSPA